MPTTCRFALAALLLLLAAAPASACIVMDDDGTLVVCTNESLPQRGMSMKAVTRHFGEPVSRHGPVGQPPISRWDYSGFSVFFEHHLVLHSVIVRNGEAPPALE